MKKILFLFMMFMGLISSLFALDTGQSGCDIKKSHTQSEWSMDYVHDAPTIASDVAFVGVNILHKDTLMYGWGEGLEDKKMEIDGDIFAPKVQIANATMAVVCLGAEC